MTLQTVFGILVVLYSVSNLASMGLELNVRGTIESLRSARLVVLALVWGCVVGPALALLLTKVLPLSEPHAVGLLVFSLAPVAPFLPVLVRRARADMDFSAALVPLVMVATVVLLPVLAPLLIEGLTVSAWSLAKPLLLLVLLPLVVSAAIKARFAPVAGALLPVAKGLAGVSTLLILGFTVVFYFREFLRTLGSFAIAAEVLFVLAHRPRVLLLRLRPEARAAQRDGAGDVHPECLGDVRGVHGLPGPASWRAGDDPAVRPRAGPARAPLDAPVRVPG